MKNDALNIISKQVLEGSIIVHKEMGAGLLESVYELCLIKELQLRNFQVQSQVSIPLIYKGYQLSKDFRIDILVENEVIIEIKAVDVLLPVH